MGKDVAQTCGSSFLSHFGGRSLSSQLDASAIMSLVMFKGNFERIAFSLSRFKLKPMQYAEIHALPYKYNVPLST